MMFPRALLVDMDGTLVDSESRWLVAETQVMAELDMNWTHEDQMHCLGGPIERLVSYIREKSQTKLDEVHVSERLLVLVEAAFRDQPLEWRTGMIELLREGTRQGIPIGLVTASSRSLVDVVLAQLESDLGYPAFTTVVAHGDAKRGKPHPDPYALGARRLGVGPRDALALEDSLTGVTSAVAAGCAVIAVPHLVPIAISGAACVEDLSHHSIASLWSLARDHRLQN